MMIVRRLAVDRYCCGSKSWLQPDVRIVTVPMTMGDFNAISETKRGCYSNLTELGTWNIVTILLSEVIFCRCTLKI